MATILFIIIITNIFVSIYLHFKMIFLLEENGVRISKLSSPFTVLNKFSSSIKRQELRWITYQQAKTYIILAKISFSLFIMIIIGLLLLIILNR